MVGAYGEWAAQKMQDPPRLPFRQANYSGVETWRPIARARFREPLAGVCAASEIHDGPHKLALDMQKEALEWSDRWLNSESRRTTMPSISECPELLEQGFPSEFPFGNPCMRCGRHRRQA